MFFTILHQALHLTFHQFAHFSGILFGQDNAGFDHVIADLHAIVRLQIEVKFNGFIFFVRGFFPTFALIRDAQPEFDHVLLVGHGMLTTQQFQLETCVFSKEFMLQQLFDGRPFFFV